MEKVEDCEDVSGVVVVVRVVRGYLKRDELVVDAAYVEDADTEAKHFVERSEVHLAD